MNFAVHPYQLTDLSLGLLREVDEAYFVLHNFFIAKKPQNIAVSTNQIILGNFRVPESFQEFWHFANGDASWSSDLLNRSCGSTYLRQESSFFSHEFRFLASLTASSKAQVMFTKHRLSVSRRKVRPNGIISSLLWLESIERSTGKKNSAHNYGSQKLLLFQANLVVCRKPRLFHDVSPSDADAYTWPYQSLLHHCRKFRGTVHPPCCEIPESDSGRMVQMH